MIPLHILQHVLLLQETRFLGKSHMLDKRSGYEGSQEVEKVRKQGPLSQAASPTTGTGTKSGLVTTLIGGRG